ncbi:hypothetical protein TWF132_007251 [Orbilia oligospora]|nr:hypothetical protein TWF132_007251 [Orbilia oligospora]
MNRQPDTWTGRIIDLWALTPYFRLLLIHADYQSIHPGHDSMVRTQFLGHERHGYGLLADSERIDIFVVPTPTMTNSFVNIRRRTQPSSNFDMKRSRAGEVQSQKPSPSDSCSSSHQSMLPHKPNDHFESEIILKAPS